MLPVEVTVPSKVHEEALTLLYCISLDTFQYMSPALATPSEATP